MKIYTITCHRVYNHGAALQAWALASFLNQQGHDAHIIDYRPDYLRGHYTLRVANPIYDKPIIKWLYLAAKYPGWKKSLKRKLAFDRFDEKYIAPLVTSKTYYSAAELRSYPPSGDIYIAGSDQIWNTTFPNGTDSSFYLNFGADTVRRVSYAASFATSSLKEGTEQFVRTHLSQLDAISVREPSGIKLLQTMGYEGNLVCDPVFLIDADEWISQIATRDGEGEKYVLVYDFECNKEIQSVAQKIARAKGLKIFSIGPWFLRYADRCYLHAGPDAFVSLVKNADCVLSNSFHATAFSFIFHRDVFVVKRADGLNTRMQDLLRRFGLQERMVENATPLEALLKTIDYTSVQPTINREIETSKKWLLDNIRG